MNHTIDFNMWLFFTTGCNESATTYDQCDNSMQHTTSLYISQSNECLFFIFLTKWKKRMRKRNILLAHKQLRKLAILLSLLRYNYIINIYSMQYTVYPAPIHNSHIPPTIIYINWHVSLNHHTIIAKVLYIFLQLSPCNQPEQGG